MFLVSVSVPVPVFGLLVSVSFSLGVLLDGLSDGAWAMDTFFILTFLYSHFSLLKFFFHSRLLMLLPCFVKGRETGAFLPALNTVRS